METGGLLSAQDDDDDFYLYCLSVFQTESDTEEQHTLTVHAVPGLLLTVFQTVIPVSC